MNDVCGITYCRHSRTCVSNLHLRSIGGIIPFNLAALYGMSWQVKEVKEKAMTMLSPHRMAAPHGFPHADNENPDQVVEMRCQPFISLLEFIGEIYQVCLLLAVNDVRVPTICAS